MGKSKTSLTERSGVTGKECSKCNEWKSLEEFGKHKTGIGQRQSACQVCSNIQKAQWREKNKDRQREMERKWEKENRSHRREYLRTYHKEWIKDNEGQMKEYFKDYHAKYFQEKKQENYVRKDRRRARKQSLPDTLTKGERRYALAVFKGCALTGSNDFHFDHVIPLATGHGGTTKENMIPLRSDLNTSKGARNLFEWFSIAKDEYSLSEAKFTALVDYLAHMNSMTPEEYKSYVYQCYES